MGTTRLSEVEEAWDLLVTLSNYERTPQRIAWFRRSFEIQGDFDEWLENKVTAVIDDYASLRKIPFDEGHRELMARPIKPWPKGK
jgi:hypothetical protein